MNDKPATIGPESRISVALLGGILSVAITATAGGAFWVSRVNTRLGAIEAALERPNPEAFTRWEMRVWVERLRGANPAIAVPTPD